MNEGLKPLQEGRRTALQCKHGHEQKGNHNAELNSVIGYHDSPPQRHHQKSHQGDGDEFNDSAIGTDMDHAYSVNSGGILSAYASSGRSVPSSHRTVFSDYSAPDFQTNFEPSSYSQATVLPSFNSTFGTPSLNSVMHHQPPHKSNGTSPRENN